MNTRSFLSATALAFATAISLSACSSDDSSDNNSSGGGGGGLGKVDCTYDGGAVTIGDQTWMAENLNCNVAGSKCYDNDPANCAKYGRLYDWVTAMSLPSSCNERECSSQISAKHRGICPSGWHIPSEDEWETLSDYVNNAQGCSLCYAKHLKATSGWNSCDASGSSNSCEDTYGFAALPGGVGYSGSNFSNVGDNGYWWSATESSAYGAYYWEMYYNFEFAYWYRGLKDNFWFSVRCLQD